MNRIVLHLLLPSCMLFALPPAHGATPAAPASRAFAGAQSASGTARDAGLPAMIEAARADAAQRTGLAAEALEVRSAEAVVWPDGSLGCARPGVRYTMALVSGYRIQIQAGEQLLDYHAAQAGQLLLCPAARAKTPLPDARR